MIMARFRSNREDCAARANVFRRINPPWGGEHAPYDNSNCCEPQDIKAEEPALGSILIDGECLTRLEPMLTEGDFYRERNQICFDAAMALFQPNHAVDQITLAVELRRTEKLYLVGGMAYLSHLVSITPTSVHAED